MRWLIFLGLISVAVFTALNWRAHLQTQQRLDALSARLAEQPATSPQLPPGVLEPRPLPKETPAKPAQHVIESPDILLIEAVVKDPKTGATSRLPDPAITNPCLVRPDGTVGLGFWGSVHVAGLTTDEAKTAVRDALIQTRPTLLNTANLVVKVEVQAYNSKVYYVITDTADSGEQVARLPLSGNETVLDAISHTGGIHVAGKTSVRVSRPGANGSPDQILPVDWKAITQLGDTTTNYQLMPGDRLYVKCVK